MAGDVLVLMDHLGIEQVERAELLGGPHCAVGQDSPPIQPTV
jgi:hypothetical protein